MGGEWSSVSQGVCSSDIEEGGGVVVSVSQGVCSSDIEEGGGGSGRLSHRGYVRLT